MGGKNPNLIFADADLDDAITTSVRSSFRNQGQICLCGSRILVERPLLEEFTERFVEETRKLRVGDPLEPDTDQGAIVSRAQLDKVKYYVDLAREEGGDILCGGDVPSDLPERCADGYFYQPTIIAGLGPDCRVNREEIFGPVVTILPFDTEEEALELANGTEYGLSATVWTTDLGRAHRVASRLQAGTIWVNCWMVRDLRVPFGGMKSSGVGREGGQEALRFFTEPRNVCVKIPAERSAAKPDTGPAATSADGATDG
jgi:aminomuconate-semialdehyde/2-hydroxymuconate-6-semialdehyde dehydrogenase